MNEQTVLVTGASSGIGRAICCMLLEKKYTVFGIGRKFEDREVASADRAILSPDTKCDHSKVKGAGNFIPVVCDLLETSDFIEKVKKIKKENDISLLVNAAGLGYYGLHEELSPEKISRMARVNLEIPMILSNILLRDLKKNSGTIVNISSVTAKKSSPHGCAYAATKAGLSSFSESLFDEARKYGVKVINIQPDMTKTNLYRDADFTVGEEEESYLLPEEIADVLAHILEAREGMVTTNITIRPQIHRIKKK